MGHPSDLIYSTLEISFVVLRFFILNCMHAREGARGQGCGVFTMVLVHSIIQTVVRMTELDAKMLMQSMRRVVCANSGTFSVPVSLEIRM